MARPRKQGIDYFPFDVDFFQDEKVVAIAGEFGLKGEITMIKLLCAVYRNGYFVEWSEMMKYKLLTQLPGVSAELLDHIVLRLVKWGFFDKGLFDSASVLTSSGIQRRYFEAVKYRRQNADLPFLLSLPQENPPKTVVSSKKTPVSHTLTPQIKRNKSKVKILPTVVDNIATSGKTTATALKTLEKVSLEKSIASMQSDQIWGEAISMRYALSTDSLKARIAEFEQHCKCLGQLEHTDITAAKRHFCLWLNKNKTAAPQQTPAQKDYSDDDFGSVDC